MNIDGHSIRTDSIDGVTEIEITVGGVSEGNDRMARGMFHVLVRGYKLTIYRNKRFRYEPASNNEELKAANIKLVHGWLTEIRDPVCKVFA